MNKTPSQWNGMKDKFMKRTIVFLFISLSFLASRGQKYLVEQYTEIDGLSNSTVFDLEQDKRGQMWFATKNGISM
ncbi:MAG: hypothetical protein K9G47_13325, partial [Bacteroidales bacterium]|nr:hypothetical protein [Bacteroidales bacterium]